MLNKFDYSFCFKSSNKAIVSVNIYTCSYLALFSRMVLFVFLKTIVEEDCCEEGDDGYVCEGWASGGCVLVVHRPLLLGSPESGELPPSFLYEGCGGRGANHLPAEDGGGGGHPYHGRSNDYQSGSDDLGNAHGQLWCMTLNLKTVGISLMFNV